MRTQTELQVADLLGRDTPDRWEIAQREGYILVSVGGRECQTAELPPGADVLTLALAVEDCQARLQAVCQAAFRARVGNGSWRSSATGNGHDDANLAEETRRDERYP